MAAEPSGIRDVGIPTTDQTRAAFFKMPRDRTWGRGRVGKDPLTVIEAVALAALLAAGIGAVAAPGSRRHAREVENELAEARAATARARVVPVAVPEAPFHELAEAVHEAVLVHGERVLLPPSPFPPPPGQQ